MQRSQITTNLNPPKRGFSDDEFQQRLERAQQLMQKQGMDLLLLTTEAEIRYFTGFLTPFWQSPTRPWFLLVPTRGQAVAVIPEIGVALMQQTWLDDIRCWPSPRPEDEGISLLIDSILQLAGKRALIGLMTGSESIVRMPLDDLAKVKDSLPDAGWLNCTPLIRELRLIKSAAEISKLSYICQVAANSFDQANQLFHVGQSLESSFRAFKIELLQQGADDVPYLVGAAGQGGYGNILSPPTDRPLQSGDILMLDTGATFDGYYCDFDRNYALVKASDASKRAYDVLYRATEAGLAAARPSVSCAALYQAMYRVIEAAGGDASAVGRLGHGLGMQLTEWPSHTATDQTVIRAGMVLTLEPSLSIGPGKSMVHEENILIHDDGATLLSRRATAELPILS